MSTTASTRSPTVSATEALPTLILTTQRPPQYQTTLVRLPEISLESTSQSNEIIFTSTKNPQVDSVNGNTVTNEIEAEVPILKPIPKPEHRPELPVLRPELPTPRPELSVPRPDLPGPLIPVVQPELKPEFKPEVASTGKPELQPDVPEVTPELLPESTTQPAMLVTWAMINENPVNQTEGEKNAIILMLLTFTVYERYNLAYFM